MPVASFAAFFGPETIQRVFSANARATQTLTARIALRLTVADALALAAACPRCSGLPAAAGVLCELCVRSCRRVERG